MRAFAWGAGEVQPTTITDDVTTFELQGYDYSVAVRRLTVAAEPLNDAEVREHFAFFDSDEYRDGVRSFLAKTKPNFN